MSEYLKCPKCGSTMVERKKTSKFFGCSEFPKCDGKLQPWEQDGKKVLQPEDLRDTFSGYGECNRCGRMATRDVMGHCESCAEWFDNE